MAATAMLKTLPSATAIAMQHDMPQCRRAQREGGVKRYYLYSNLGSKYNGHRLFLSKNRWWAKSDSPTAHGGLPTPPHSVHCVGLS